MTSRLRMACKAVSAAVAQLVTDIGGWKTYTPVAKDANPMNSFALQTGSRIYYVDPSKVALASVALDIAAGDYYGISAGNIIDSSGSTTGAGGVPYGTDPFNPTGPIKPYPRVGYVLYNRFGNNRVNGTVMTGDYTSAGNGRYDIGAGRNGRPDYFLTKKATTLALEDDLYATCLEGNPELTRANLLGSLSIPGGSSLAAMSVVGSYGPASAARTTVTKAPPDGFMASGGVGKAIEFHAYVSLYFDGYSRSHYTSVFRSLSYMNSAGVAGAKNVWHEDCVYAGTEGWIIQRNTDLVVEFLRCQLFDTYGGHNSGVFTGNFGNSAVNWRQSLVGRNGKLDNPMLAGGGTDSIFDRNFYYGGECDPLTQVMDDCIVLAGGSADQFRAGGRLTRNYFVLDGVGLAAQGGSQFLVAKADTGVVQQNVLETYSKGAGRISGGFGLFYGAHHVDVSDNVVTDAGQSQAERDYSATSGAYGTGTLATGWYHENRAPTQLNSIHDNTAIGRVKAKLFSTSEGVPTTNLIRYISNGAGAATWAMFGSQVVSATTAAYAAGTTTLVLNQLALVDTTATSSVYMVGIVMTNGQTHWTTYTPGISSATITLAVGLPVGCALGASVTCAPQDKYSYRSNTNNAHANNRSIGQSGAANATDYTAYDTAGISPTDSNTYTANSVLSLAQAVTASYDIDRCLRTYCQSIGLPLTSANYDQDGMFAELIAYWKANMRKGQWDVRFEAKNVVNHVRSGIGMAAV